MNIAIAWWWNWFIGILLFILSTGALYVLFFILKYFAEKKKDAKLDEIVNVLEDIKDDVGAIKKKMVKK
jgi:hypothetical protein